MKIRILLAHINSHPDAHPTYYFHENCTAFNNFLHTMTTHRLQRFLQIHERQIYTFPMHLITNINFAPVIHDALLYLTSDTQTYKWVSVGNKFLSLLTHKNLYNKLFSLR